MIRGERLCSVPCFLGILASLLLCCDPEVSVTEWTPVAYEAILADMGAPTGVLLDDDPTVTVTQLNEQLASAGGIEGAAEALRTIYRQMVPLLDALEGSEGGAPYTDEVQVNGGHGTTVYARLSCLGRDLLAPVSDFSEGELYLEGPTFSLESLIESVVTIDGDMLGEFRNGCHIGDMEISGRSPGFFSDFADHLMMDFDLSVRPSNGATRRIRFPALVVRNGVRFLFRTAQRGAYVIGISVDNAARFSVGTARGTYSCSIGGPDRFSCSASSGIDSAPKEDFE